MKLSGKVPEDSQRDEPKEPKKDKNEDHECVICMERQAEISLSGCNHEFCESCIQQWNQKSHTCPMCRQEAEYGSDDWVITVKNGSLGDYFVKVLSEL